MKSASFPPVFTPSFSILKSFSYLCKIGIPTLVYLPYCFFNIISPLMTLLVAAIGWKIYRTPPTEALENEEKEEVNE